MVTSHNAAGTVHALVRAVLGSALPLHIRCWDGSEAGPPDAPVRLVLRHRRALRRLVWAPNEIGLARAFVSGDLDVESDFFESLSSLERILKGSAGPRDVDRQTKWELFRSALRLGAIGLPPKPPAEEIRLGGPLHSLRRDSAAISHHYDVGNDFYALVLGPSMTYSCAVWDDDAKTLEDAQTAKVDLVARKLGLNSESRVLDVGCGWGTFVIHAAREYGAHAVGVTLSQAQADFARKRAAEEGLSELVEIRVQDYREVRDGPFDAIASIGMAEHVGLSQLPTYTAALYALLRPGGRLLNHAISRKAGVVGHTTDRTSFINRYVFPDGELETLSTMTTAIEDAGFEVRDVEALREHYALTLREWVANLEANWDKAVRLTSEGRARVWRLYMAASALTFESGSIGVNQVLAVKSEDGKSGLPRTRKAWLS
nr:cyclopropane-fatty-acyl-phospholipid synthase family protein [Amycolatopsis acidicola]